MLFRTSRPARRPSPARGRFRPRLEALEGRDVPSFGTNGIVATDVVPNGRDFIKSMAMQPADGKIVAAGNGGIVRYNPDGGLDNSFNPGGAVPGTVPLA